MCAFPVSNQSTHLPNSRLIANSTAAPASFSPRSNDERFFNWSHQGRFAPRKAILRLHLHLHLHLLIPLTAPSDSRNTEIDEGCLGPLVPLTVENRGEPELGSRTTHKALGWRCSVLSAPCFLRRSAGEASSDPWKLGFLVTRFGPTSRWSVHK